MPKPLYFPKTYYLCICKVGMTKQTMSKTIRHTGIVERISGQRVWVRIEQPEACGSCQMASRCAASEKKSKLIEAMAGDTKAIPSLGQHVVVATAAGSAWLAVILVFAVPLALMLVAAIAASQAGTTEPQTALSAVGVLIPYYIIIWLCRQRIERQVAFHVETDESKQ